MVSFARSTQRVPRSLSNNNTSNICRSAKPARPPAIYATRVSETTCYVRLDSAARSAHTFTEWNAQLADRLQTYTRLGWWYLLDSTQAAVAMEWTKEETLEFISCYKTFSLLWDCEHEFYKDRIERYAALDELAKKFSTQVPEVERKIKNLQSHFLRERKKHVASKKRPTWFAYKPLSFLLTRKFPRKIKVNSEELQRKAHEAIQKRKQTENSHAAVTTQDHNAPATRPQQPDSNLVVKELFKWFRDRDEFDLYGEQVALKLRQIASPIARVTVQNRMNSLLLEAEMGMYDNASQYMTPSQIMDLYPETKVHVGEANDSGS